MMKKEKVKQFVKTFLINFISVGLTIAILQWLGKIVLNQIIYLVGATKWFLSITPLPIAIPIIVILTCIAIYALGNYSIGALGALIFSPNKNREIFFTIKMTSPFEGKGYIHGYITKKELRDDCMYYTAIFIFGGITPVTDLK